MMVLKGKSLLISTITDAVIAPKNNRATLQGITASLWAWCKRLNVCIKVTRYNQYCTVWDGTAVVLLGLKLGTKAPKWKRSMTNNDFDFLAWFVIVIVCHFFGETRHDQKHVNIWDLCFFDSGHPMFHMSIFVIGGGILRCALFPLPVTGTQLRWHWDFIWLHVLKPYSSYLIVFLSIKVYFICKKRKNKP